MAILHTMIYRFNVIHIKVSTFFLQKLMKKFMWKCKKLRRAISVLKKDKVWGFTFPYFTIDCKSAISVVLAQQECRSMESMWKSIYNQLTFYNDVRQFNKGKNSFQQMVLGQLDIHILQWTQISISHYKQKLTKTGS